MMASEIYSEKSPLLTSDQQPGIVPNYTQTSQRQHHDLSDPTSSNVVNVPSVGVDELPPPYTATSTAGTLMISCKVCGFMIDISSKREQHVVKCSNCNEATPVRTAPAGKKYVRCPCNCLLICKTNSDRIACPRPQCKKVISLTQNPATPSTPTVPGMCQVSCAHCHNLFLFNTLNNSLARCPHCRKVSSVGHHFAQRRGWLYLIAAIIVLNCAIATIVVTVHSPHRNGGIYVAYIILPLVAVLMFARAIYFFMTKTSVIEGLF